MFLWPSELLEFEFFEKTELVEIFDFPVTLVFKRFTSLFVGEEAPGVGLAGEKVPLANKVCLL